MSIIEVKDLRKSYNGLEAVKGVSFKVEEGEIFGILGPNGAGKTTTLEILEGIKKADSGQAVIAGFDALANPKSAKKIIGVQLQSENFFEDLSLQELLELFGKIYNQPVDAAGLLKKVNLSAKADKQYKDLSGGQQRRFSIAAATVNQPKVLFLDEPTTGLDPQSRRYAWELIKAIRQSGVTIILTTHYMEEAQTLCDRIAIMDHGQIVALDTPRNLIKQLPVNNYISFTTEKYIAQADLDRLYGVIKSYKENGAYFLETRDAEATLLRLLQESYDNHLNITNLNLRTPTLEDVFIHLTGHSLRE